MRNNVINKLTLVFVLVVFFSCKQKQADVPVAAQKEAQGSQSVKSSQSDIDIHYSIEGKGNHALVFVHGWSCDQTYWEKQISYFKDRYKVVTIDLGGHGKSGTNRNDWTMDAFATDVADVLNTIEYTELNIVGHSMGSVVVLNTVPRLDDKLKNIVFVDYFKNKPQTILPKEQIEKMTTGFKLDFVNTTKGFVKGMFLKNADTILVNRIATNMSKANPVIAIEAMVSMMQYDVDTGFKKLRDENFNVHLINSDQRPVDTAYFDSIGFKSNSIENTGHFLMLEQDKAFNELLENILR